MLWARHPVSWKHACSEETVTPCRGTRELSDTNTPSPLLWNHNRHVVPYLLAVPDLNLLRLKSLSCQVRERRCSLSVSALSLRLATKGWKTLWCARAKGSSGLCFHFVWVFVLSVSPLCLLFFFFFFCLRLMLHGWQLVATSWGTWSLPTVGLLSSWVPCHLGSCHPGEGDTPCWSTYCLAGPMTPETHSLTGWITVRVTTFVDPSNPSWQ